MVGGIISRPSEATSSMLKFVKRAVILYGVCGGLLIVVLKLVEYRFLVVEHSIEI
jgi:hypothetical protein